MPFFGRRVIDDQGAGINPGSIFKLNCCAIVANTRVASMRAKELPMHWRGPPPKGKYAYLGILFIKPLIQPTLPDLTRHWILMALRKHKKVLKFNGSITSPAYTLRQSIYSLP